MPDDEEVTQFQVDVAQIDWERAFKFFFTALKSEEWTAWTQENIRPLTTLIVTGVVGILTELANSLGAVLGESIDRVEKESGKDLLKAAAAGLSDIFGMDISPGDLGFKGGTDQRRQASQRIADFVLKQMFREFGAGEGITPEQGFENAKKLLGFNLSSAIEGWMTGVLSHSVLAQFIPNWADLDEIMEKALGLGRLNRRIMAPLLDATIVEPWRWDLNKRFRPEIYRETQAVRALFRGEINDDEYFETMARHGWSREKAATLKVVNSRLPEKEDIGKAVELGIISEEKAGEIFRALGYPPDVADMMRSLALDDRVRTLNTALESTARDMFRDREISEAEYRRLIQAAGRTTTEEAVIVGLGFIERSRPRRLSRAQMERAFVLDIKNLDDLQEYFLEEGYTLGDALTLEQLALDKKYRFEEMEARRHAAAEKRAQKAKN